MFFRTIRERIFVTLAVTVVSISLFVFMYLLNNLQSRLFDFFDSVNQTINTMLVVNSRGYIYNKDTKNLQLFLDSIESKYVKNIFILDADGNVMVQKYQKYSKGKKYRHFDHLRKRKKQSIKTKELYVVLNTLKLLDVPLGYVVMEGNTEQYFTVLNEEKKSLILFSLGIVLLFLSITYYLSNSISKPVRVLVQTLQNVKDNEVIRFTKPSELEFAFLAKTIEEKHNALLKLYGKLEAEVRHKTRELQELNETLEEKVDEAVKDIQAKDRLLQDQSRFAQMGEMLAMIAHQWRQPLGAISASTVGIQTKIALKKYNLANLEERELFYRYLEHKLSSIQDYVMLLTETIEDFRKFFRYEQHKTELVINDPIERVLHILEALIDKHRIHVVKKMESRKRLSILQNEFMQVVMNILTNASDALQENSVACREVVIHTYDTDNAVVVQICDNAGGISEDIIDKIFDPYFSTKDEKNGTGLGLYMAKLIIEEHHHAKIHVDVKENKTCFMIEFFNE